MSKQDELIVQERIARSIHLIRQQKVMLDSDLAELYGVETKVLNQAVKRNLEVTYCDLKVAFNARAVPAYKTFNESKFHTTST
jgi:hypothetical protein